MAFIKYLVAIFATAVPATLANPDCSPTGAGTCTLTIWGDKAMESIANPPWFPILRDRMDWKHAVISNNACEDISGDVKPYQGYAMDSQLPYTVVFERLSPYGNYNSFRFCYAGSCYDGGAACEIRSQTGDYWETNYCRRAFDC
ncbi:uncharacterized protein BHQ10_008425 [Talaromyces amestolkiae]|uniref:Uncharacterized protein n=1 Tax=Talaromyces amestolkiae TaxID=1196081 RepID=A0A364L9G3_TALAM|nr:uncharacterized protein BHQ10_008425 [Talaromyces amestolkiae]RAO72413.1 hypothetical protein BHQ10_008425 [Talaromyces amestolkiae]